MGIEEQRTVWGKFVSGDYSFFEDVYKEYYPNLFRYGVKLCSKPEFVKDNIQDLFENIWKNRGKLSHIESPFYYLSVSLRRKIFKKISRQKKQKEKLSKLSEDKISIEFGVEEVIIQDESVQEQREELVKALNQLPVKQREVVYLRFYQGMSYREIANILSINRQSVRNHIYRAMEVMRTLLGGEAINIVHFSQTVNF